MLIIAVFCTTLFLLISKSHPPYTGKTVELSQPGSEVSFQIDNVVLSKLNTTKKGVQSTIYIKKYSGKYAQGTVSYSDKSPTQQFIAAKVNDSWTIVAHNSGKSLVLPDIKTAELFQLPKGWFKP